MHTKKILELLKKAKLACSVVNDACGFKASETGPMLWEHPLKQRHVLAFIVTAPLRNTILVLV